jgi:lysophospholipase L1-like esterase
MGRETLGHGWRILGRAGAVRSAALLLTFALALSGCDVGARSAGGQPAQPAQPGQALFPQPTLTYVAIGASDAFGVGTDDPTKQCWPSVLAGQLGSSVRVLNLGIPGATIAQAAQDEVPVALDAQPKLITVLLGTNDLVNDVPLETSMRHMRALLAALRQGTQATVYVGNLPDLTLLPYFVHHDQAALRIRIADFNSALDDLVVSEGAVVVDVHGQWADLAAHPEYISADGLHPSAAGEQRLARFFVDAIQRTPPQGQQSTSPPA